MEKDLSITIRANWDRIRTEKGLTVQMLADKLGVTRQTIYCYFRPGCSINTIQKAAALIGAEPWQLLAPLPGGSNPAQIICPHCGQPIQITATAPEHNTTTREHGPGSDPGKLELF